MYSKEVLEAVGRYGGAIGIIFLTFGSIVGGLARFKMKGSSRQAQKRFLVLAYLSFAAAVIAIVAWSALRWSFQRVAPNDNTIVKQETHGDKSPIVNDNHGTVNEGQGK